MRRTNYAFILYTYSKDAQTNKQTNKQTNEILIVRKLYSKSYSGSLLMSSWWETDR